MSGEDYTRLPWEAPIRGAGPSGDGFVPGGLNHHHEFWEKVALSGHPQKQQLLSYVRDGVSVFDSLKDEFKGASRSTPYQPEAFPEAVIPKRIPAAHAAFVHDEVHALVRRGCLVPWSEVRGEGGPTRPRLVLSISVEPDKAKTDHQRDPPQRLLPPRELHHGNGLTRPYRRGRRGVHGESRRQVRVP